MHPPKEIPDVPWLGEFIELLVQKLGTAGDGECTGLTGREAFLIFRE